MSILRSLIVAMLMVLAGATAAEAQTVEDYGTLAGDGSTETAETGGAGLYDTLRPEDYERVGRDLSMLQATQSSISEFRTGAIKILSKTPVLIPELIAGIEAQSPTGSAWYFVGIAVWMLLFFMIAYAIEWQVYGMRLVGPWFISLQIPNPRGIAEKLPILALRAIIGLFGILISLIIVGLLTAAVLDLSDPATQKTVIVVAATVAASRASAIIWRMVISPYLPNYRLPPLDDSCARKLFNWLWITVTLSLSLLAFCYWAEDLGVDPSGHKLLTLIATFVMVFINVAMVIANRPAISQAFLGADPDGNTTWLMRLGAAFWAPVAIVYILGAWAVSTYRLVVGLELGPPLIVGAYTILLAVIVVYGIVAFVIARLFQRRREMVASRAAGRAADLAEDEASSRLRIIEAQRVEGDPIGGDGEDEGGPSAAAFSEMERAEIAPRLGGLRDFEGLAKRVATIFAIGAGLYALAHIWKLDYLFEEGRILDRAEDIIDILLIGYIAYQAMRIWIDTKIQEELGDTPELEPGDEGGGASAATRLATLLPLFRNFMLFIIAASVVLLILLEMGVQVAPIFAGAGVVGIAIGFGAQTLIRDILSGAFFLVDDAFRKGEYIDVGSVKGTVEKISMRSFQLRHHLGALHTIPFGEIQHLTNFSRDWVMMKLPIRLTYDTDVEKVRKLVKKLGQQLLEHPTEGEKFLQPLKSQGVYKMEDSAMIIRVKFMTRPGDQWTTRKLVYSSIRELFAQEGIKFAHREVTVRLGDGENVEDLTPEQREKVAAAAHEAVSAADRDAAQPARAVGDDR